MAHGRLREYSATRQRALQVRNYVLFGFDSLMSEIKIIKSFLNEETEIQTSSEASRKPRKMRVCVGVLKITWSSGSQNVV